MTRQVYTTNRKEPILVFCNSLPLQIKMLRLIHCKVQQALQTQVTASSKVCSRVLTLETDIGPSFSLQICWSIIAKRNFVKMSQCGFMLYILFIVRLYLDVWKLQVIVNLKKILYDILITSPLVRSFRSSTPMQQTQYRSKNDLFSSWNYGWTRVLYCFITSVLFI